MNLKISLLFFLCFTSFLLRGQSGRAYYAKKISTPKSEISDPNVEKAIKLMSSQRYLLSFNKDLASFKKVKMLNIETNRLVEAYANSFSNFSGEYYYDDDKKIGTHKKEFVGKSFLINDSIYNWKLIKEQLKIGKYHCYKATTEMFVQNSSGSHKLVAIAWYAPNISVPFGPDGFWGLPGLIVRLDYNGTITSLENIEFLKNEDISIELPNEGKQITKKEYDAMVAKAFSKRFENY